MTLPVWQNQKILPWVVLEVVDEVGVAEGLDHEGLGQVEGQPVELGRDVLAQCVVHIEPVKSDLNK